MNKDKGRKIFLYSIIVISVMGLLYSSINIVKWYIDSKTTAENIKTVQDKIRYELITNEIGTNVVDIDINSPYYKFMNEDMMAVNFEELLKINSQIKGWLKVNGTDINYPFVQNNDNEFYLNHSINKKYNQAGWVFMDYRNNPNIEDRNTIIYAHGRQDDTMFGSLKSVLKKKWLNNSDNYIIKMSSVHRDTVWQIFSVYHIPTTSDYIQIHFNDDNEFINWTDMIKNRSFHNFNVDLTKDDKILTLSTCYNQKEKMVVHARLIKISDK